MPPAAAAAAASAKEKTKHRQREKHQLPQILNDQQPIITTVADVGPAILNEVTLNQQAENGSKNDGVIK